MVDNKANLLLKKKVITVRDLVKMKATRLVDPLVVYLELNNSEQTLRRIIKFLNNKTIIIFISNRWSETKLINLEPITPTIVKVENTTQLQVSVHNHLIVIFHQLVREIVHKIQMTSTDRIITNSWFINNQNECWTLVKTIIVLVTHQGQIVKLEQADTYSHKVVLNQTMEVVNTITRCNSRCHIKIVNPTEDNLFLDTEWIKFPAKLEESSQIHKIMESCKIKEQLLQPSQDLKECMEEKGTLLEPRNNSWATNNRIRLEDMLTKFINNSF